MKISLNTISFGLPAKSFFIDYTVSQKRQLPVVKEFVVRLIHTLSEITVDTIQEYFGFTDREMLAVIDDLIEESLIEWSEDKEKIKLSNYASSQFVEIDGQMIPRFFEVTEKSDTVHFEMHGFKMLPNTVKKGGANDLCISLPLPSDCYKNLSVKAQNAFDLNFQQFREFVKEENIFSERQELYKINQVAHKYDALIPVDVNYYVDTSSPLELKTEYESAAIDEWDSSKSLFTVMDEAVTRTSTPNEAKNFASYLSFSQDPIISRYWDDSSTSLNIPTLLDHFEKGETHYGNDTQLIIGNIYSEFNSEGLLSKLKEKLNNENNSSGLVWFTHSDSATWGRNNSINTLITQILKLFDRRKSTSKAVMVMQCSSKQEAFELNKRYRTLDAHLLDCTSRLGGESTEVLLIPNIMVVCLHHAIFDSTRNISLPVGYVSFDERLISTITNSALTWSASETVFNHYFEKRHTEKSDTVLNKIFSPILTQSIHSTDEGA